MNGEIQVKKKKGLLILAIILILTGCAYQQEDNETEKQLGTGFVMATAGVFDSADTAVVVRTDDGNSTITLKNLDIGKQYTLNYDGMTYIKDKYDEAMSMAQIMPGDIVEVTFFKEKKRLNSIKLSPEAWTYTDIDRFAIDNTGKSMAIANEHYGVDKNVSIVSEGAAAEMMDINESDKLIVRGIEKTVYSIVVDKGHGYLRLQNDEYFIGGWIEVGQVLIQTITEDMLLTIPEGNYTVLVSNKGSSGTKEITITRNKETELDIGDLKGEEVKIGNVLFTLTPSTATLQIDGKEVDVSNPIALEYGIHEMLIKAEGYKTIRQYIKVGQEMATIEVEMEEISEDDEEESISSNQVSDNTANGAGNSNNNNANTNTTVSGNNGNSNNNNNTSGSVSNNTSGTVNSTTTYRVKIEAPVGAEAYVNGNYVGIVPINFKKVEGNYSITLRKEGYQTRSYTIQVDAEKKDVAFSFSDLIKSE